MLLVEILEIYLLSCVIFMVLGGVFLSYKYFCDRINGRYVSYNYTLPILILICTTVPFLNLVVFGIVIGDYLREILVRRGVVAK